MTKRTRLSLVGIALAIAAVVLLVQWQAMDTASAGSTNAQHNGHPVVVELFTSQGCYSCPPADKYVGVLKKRENVIALAYHVDYWGYTGWKDPFATNTQRQRGYRKAMGLWSIYTPQMVIDGRLEGAGSRTGEISDKIGRVSTMSLADRVSIPVALQANRPRLRVEIEGGAAPEAGDIWLVTYDEERTTAIPRGENAGKSLTKYNIVRGIWRLGDWNGQPVSVEYDTKDFESLANNAVVLLQEKKPGRALWRGGRETALTVPGHLGVSLP